MRSRLLVNIILLSLVAVLAFFVFTGEDEDSDKSTKLTTINPDTIDRISIKHRQRTIALEKNQGRWHMVQPVHIRANDFRVGTLLNILETASHARYDSSGLELGSYGLADADTSITFNDTTIEFGIVNPMSDYRYVKIHDQVHLIDDYYYPLLSSQLGTLVSLNPLPANAEISKLVLPDQTLHKNEQGLWQSSKDISADAIVETIRNWQSIQAFGVHDYMQRESIGAIEVYLKQSDKPLRFEITDTDPWLILARPELNLEYHYNIENYDRLLRPGSTESAPEEPAE